MQKFLFRFFLIFTLFLILLTGFDFLVSKGLIKSGYRDFESWDKLFTGNIEDDLVIFGTSRAYVHFDPSLIETLSGIKTYNLGWNATDVNKVIEKIEYYILNLNKKPKYIIVVLDYSMFTKKEEWISRDYFPFIFEHPYLLKSIANDVSFNFKYLIPVIRYKDYYKDFKIGLKNYFISPNIKKDKVKGYWSADQEWSSIELDSLKSIYPNGIEIEFENEMAVELLNIGDQYTKEGIIVTWVIAPYHQEFFDICNNCKEISLKIDKIFNIPEYSYLDFSKFKGYQNKEYFYNSTHLNKKGVALFIPQFLEKFKRNSLNE